MLGRRCPRCGRLLRTGSYCPVCDAPASAPGPVDPTPEAGIGSVRPRATFGAPRTPSARAALSRVSWGAGLLFANSVFGWVLLGATLTGFALVVSVNSLSVAGPGLGFWVGLVSVQPVLAIVAASCFRWAFSSLATRDEGFVAPSQLSLVLLVGEAVLLVGSVVFAAAFYTTAQCNPSGLAPPASCPALGDVLFAGVLIAIGAVVGLLGLVGVAVGTWRLGSRTKSRWLKVGSVLLPIPYVNVVGDLVVLLVVRSQLARTRRATSVRVAPSG